MSLKLIRHRFGHGMAITGFMVSLIVTMIGCSTNPTTAQKQAIQAYYVDTDQASAAAQGKAFEDPSKIAPKAQSDPNPKLDVLKHEQDKAADAYAKHHDDPKAKEAYVVATDRLATATMAAPELSPKEKYPTALKMYREVLRVDPKNEEALANSELIEGIYKQLGRPIPK